MKGKFRHLKLVPSPNSIMKQTIQRSILSLGIASMAALTASAQVPTMISYQGRVLMNNTNFGGTGQFKFALVQAAGPTLLWKNDASAGNTEPGAAVSLPVANGLVMTTLGDTALANMTALPASAFAHADVRLRVWFNGGAGFQQLTPDQRIVSVGYALMANAVPDGSITAAKLANGAVTSAKIAGDAIGATQIAPGAVNSSDIADGSIVGADIANQTITGVQISDVLDLGSTGANGRLDVFRTTPAGTAAISLIGSSSQISTYGSDGLEQTRLWGPGFGELLLNNNLANNATAVNLTAQGASGGRLALNNTNGSSRAILEGENTGGLLTLLTADGNTGAVLYGNEGAGSGALSLRNTNGIPRFRAFGGPLDGSLELYSERGILTFAAEGGEGNTGSQLNMYQSNGVRSVQIDAENGVNGGGYAAVYSGDGGAAVVLNANANGGVFSLYEEDGTATVQMFNVSDSGVVSVRNSVGGETVYLWGEDSDGTADGQIGLKKASGTETITLQAGEGTGGSQILMRNAAGAQTVQLDADGSGMASGYLALYRSNSVANIILDAADGTVSAQVVEITGGSDFSEKFDINASSLEPGMIVSIDPKNPGQLTLCESAHDKKVAGIVSGAGGVKPGMLMGQAGSVADGKHPVALTGRVFCWVDADANGAIEPGDMLTTSPTAGHGMKVTDHSRSTGAVVGKAMTPLAKGKGLVLVLVNLQ